jgi:C1A family cysteine protease
MPILKSYGALPSIPNPNDNGFPAHLMKVQMATFPVRAALTGTVGQIKNQGNQGSCTAHGSTSMGERLYRRWKNQSPIFSPAYIYYFERLKEGTLYQGDCGAQVVTSLSVPDMNPTAGGFGWCPLADMPYVDTDFSTVPNAAQIAAAKAFPGGSYHTIGNIIANIKNCILSDYSGVIGISVYDSFEDDKTASSGLIPYPNVNAENLQGGHEMHSLLAYDDTIQCPNAPNPGAVLTMNSWDVTWGIKCPIPSLSLEGGFCWIPYSYLMDTNLCSDVRMQHLGRAW